jgi:hypothetical protein
MDDQRTMYDWFAASVAAGPDRVALDIDGAEVTYGELADLAEEYRDTVADLGSPEGLEDEAEELVDAASAMSDVLADALDLIDDGEDPDDDQDLVDAFAEANDDLDDAADDADLDCEPAAPEEPATTAPPATTPPASVESVLDLEPVEPSVIIVEYGTDLLLDSYADLCFNGDMGSCDDLYRESPVDDSIYSYEGYGATCGGRLTEEHPGECVSLA